MTEAELSEARELLHALWGLHASLKYDKPVHKQLWARLDTLLVATAAPIAWRCDDCGAAPDTLVRKSDHHGGTKQVCTDRAACHERSPG